MQMLPRMRVLVAIAIILARPVARADVITHGGTSISMEFVTVGNPNNADAPYGYGGVECTYRIGVYEVSEDQWDAVSEASHSDLLDDSGRWYGKQAAAHISWHEACMFTNWLTSGDVTHGVYTVDDSGMVTGIDRASAQSTYGAVYHLPTEDEWYKAAYYDPNKPGGAGYWGYPTMNDLSNPPDGVDAFSDLADGLFDAVFNEGFDSWQPNDIDNAGVLSAYGTMGQGGNVWEWTETASGSSRVFRGGSFSSSSWDLRAYADSTSGDPASESGSLGFRVASTSSVVPEPGSLAGFLGMGLTALVLMRRRR